MYQFIDVNETSTSVSLPSEAVSIDGEYIETLIDGYRTLYTSGRESLALQLTTHSVGSADGTKLTYSNYPAREIIVGFQIIASTAAELMEKLNQLNGILAVDEADFIFADEPDKYFTGIPISEMEITPGYTSITGEWQIYCPWPFKRSTDMYEVEATETGDNTGQFVINYEGTFPSKPILIAEFAGASDDEGNESEDGDCGYVAFADISENIIQLGNPSAVDIDSSDTQTVPINQTFKSLTGWTSGGDRFDSSEARAGSFSAGSVKDTYYNKGKGATYKVASPSFGSGSAWHGPCYYKDVTSTVYFNLTVTHRFCCSSSSELGTVQLGAWNGSTMVAGVRILKNKSGNYATVYYVVGGEVVGSDTINATYYNSSFGYVKRTDVKKTQYYNKKKKKWQDKKISGAKTRKVHDKYTYSANPSLKTVIERSKGKISFKVGALATREFYSDYVVPTTRFTMYCGQYGTKTKLNTNCICGVKWVSNAGSFSDLVNVFSSGDIVTADTYNATVTLGRVDAEDGQAVPQYGALGNDWESFELEPGANVINVMWSDWVNTSYKPTCKIQYNEVFI